MPRSFYMLTSTIAVGYFVVTAGHSLLLSWRARYSEAINERRELAEGKWPVTVANFTLIIGALFDFFTKRLWWWLTPALTTLGVLGRFSDSHTESCHRCNAVHVHLVLTLGLDDSPLGKIAAC